MRSAPAGRQAGFTLIELVIVLAIVGLALAMAAPRVAKNLTGLTLKTESRRVAGMLRTARSLAVNTGRLHTVVFDTRQQRIALIAYPKPAAADSDNASAQQPGDDTPPARVSHLAESISFSEIRIGSAKLDAQPGEGIYQLTFFPNGTAQGADIVLSDTKERQYRITVDFMTGTVRSAAVEDE